MKKLSLILVALVGVVLAASVMPTPGNAPVMADMGKVAPTGHVSLTAPLRPLPVGQDEHSAFPGLVKTPDGGLMLTWRQGADHVKSRDGEIMLAESSGLDSSYGARAVVETGKDYRDPSLSNIDGHLWLTYFTGTDSEPAQGAYARRDWGSPVRIDELPWAAVTAPIVKLPNGDLAAVYYGRADTAETFDSVWFARSADGGAGWTSTRIADGPAAGRAYNEPWLVVNRDVVHVLHRWGGWDSIGITSSKDGGRTWTKPRKILGEATGRPATVVFSSGVMTMVYRSTVNRSAMMATSADDGASWTVAGTLMPAPPGSPLGMTYAALQEVMPGVAQVVLGMEEADGSSNLYSGYLAAEEKLV